ncbi:MAG TPA: ABC transporter [Dermatophilaceae bacterium]|nr:ABC transporter [Dermatophilaceae bacterium]
MAEADAEGGAALLTAVAALREALTGVALPLQLPDVAEAREAQRGLVRQLDDYVIPRLEALDAPLLAVLGGSTGAGKSTLVNSLVGAVVSRTGVLRPTTRAPVLVYHPDDERWFVGPRILPELPRLTGPHDPPARGDSDQPAGVRLVPSTAVTAGLALLDAPDIDSIVRPNRELARELLAAADLWLFVTTAARYADAVPWRLLREAADRGTSVAIVLDRVPPAALEEIRNHLAEMLRDRDLSSAPIFTIPEATLTPDGLLDPRDVAPLTAWLGVLADDAAARGVVIRRTLHGALDSIPDRVAVLCAASEDQRAAAVALRKEATAAFDAAYDGVEHGMNDGSLLRGEVLARWQEFVGTGELLRNLESRIGWLRDRVVDVVRGRPRGVERVSTAVESGLETLLVEHAEAAAERAADAWRGTRAGAALLREKPTLARASRSVREEAERAVRDWQRAVFDLVAAEGAEKRSTARRLAFGVNGLAVALMVVTFVHTAGMSGAEAGIAGTSAFVGQKLLEAVFGDQAVRRLAEAARRALDERVGLLLAGEKARFDAVLSGLGDDDPQALRRAAADVEQARSAWVGA